MDIDPIDANDPGPFLQLKITSGTCGFFALGATVYRLYKRRDRLGADDAWALFAFVTLIIQVVAVFLHIPVPNDLSNTTRIAVSYLTDTTFYLIIWASRLSILFSIVRIDPSVGRRRRLFCVAAAFVATALFLIGQLFWICESQLSWKNAENPHCELTLQVAICQLVTDVISDSILLFAPLPLFRNLLDKSLGRKLTLIFSTCVATTVISLVHAVYILRDYDNKIAISAIVECSLSLIVANIPVIITTTMDIVGEPHHVLTGQFSTLLWFSEAQTTDTTELRIVDEERAGTSKLSQSKYEHTSWSQNDLSRPVSSTKAVIIAVHQRSHPYDPPIPLLLLSIPPAV